MRALAADDGRRTTSVVSGRANSSARDSMIGHRSAICHFTVETSVARAAQTRHRVARQNDKIAALMCDTRCGFRGQSANKFLRKAKPTTATNASATVPLASLAVRSAGGEKPPWHRARGLRLSACRRAKWSVSESVNVQPSAAGAVRVSYAIGSERSATGE